MIYGIISDTHNHAFSAFSTTLADGVNSRLQTTLDETWRAAQEIKKAGGSVLIHAGDLFHVRGNIAPSVLNPTVALYQRIASDLDMSVYILSGNHDLEGKESAWINSSVSPMAFYDGDGYGSIKAISEPFFMRVDGGLGIAMIPWQPTVSKLLDEMQAMIDTITTAGYKHHDYDLIIHAPVDDVIIGIPSHGLTADMLAEFGFRRVFVGHYHNHKDFGNGVYSVGALTHQTWNDVGSKAGFLTVTDETVKYNASHAPSFVDVDPDWPIEDVPLHVDGHFVRARIVASTPREIDDLRNFLVSSGAAGVVIMPTKKAAATARTGSTIKTGASLETSVNEFIKTKGYRYEKEIGIQALDVLSQVGELS